MRNRVTLLSSLAALIGWWCDLQVCQAQPSNWKVVPAYESMQPAAASQLTVTDGQQQRQLYLQSYAVLIMEGDYHNGWDNEKAAAAIAETSLRPVLEKLGFHVVVWRDLKGDGLRTVTEDILQKVGYTDDARLFLYYFGHGQVLGLDTEPALKRYFLVPVDAVLPTDDEKKFREVAYPIGRLLELAREMTLRHAFIALEACYAGGLVSTLGPPPPPNKLGYALNDQVRTPVIQVLTAGNDHQEVAANGMFTALIAKALSGGAASEDGFIYGSSVMSFVQKELPTRAPDAYPATPQVAFFPNRNGGDMVFGATRVANTATVKPHFNVAGNGPIFQPPKMDNRTIDGCMFTPEKPDGSACTIQDTQNIAAKFCEAAGYLTSQTFSTQQYTTFQASYKMSKHSNPDGTFSWVWNADDSGGFILNKVVCRN